jgi:peptidyl-prolyl cis-trans isomerase C
MGDVDAALMGSLSSQRANIMNNPKRIEELVSRLLINRQIANEARSDKLDQSPEFKQAVELQAERLLSEQYLKALREGMAIGDVEALARERYKVNPDAYILSGTTSVRHILIRAQDRSDDEAKALAETVHGKAVAGEDFLVLVNEYSNDTSKETNGGLIPNAESDAVDPAFVDAVKKLKKKGDISPVVKTQFGYHVIVLVDRIASRPRTFEQVKDNIIGELDNSMRDARLKEHVDQLKGLEIDANPDVVASLRTRYLPASAAEKPTGATPGK